MAIYNIFDYHEKDASEKVFTAPGGAKIDPEAFTSNRIDESFIPNSSSRKDKFFSALAARFFFFLLLIADVVWGAYSIVALVIKSVLCVVTFGQIPYLRTSCGRSYLAVKRAIVCAIALAVALFSPALGIMFSCMYFLMYDRSGVEEVVPTSLRDHFTQLF